MGEALALIAVLSVAVEAITYILRKAEPILPIVEIFTSRSQFLEKLHSCGYCLSFWVSMFLLGIYFLLQSNPVLLIDLERFSEIVNFFLMLLIIHRSSNIIHGSIDKYFDRHYDRRYRSFFEELDKGE